MVIFLNSPQHYNKAMKPLPDIVKKYFDLSRSLRVRKIKEAHILQSGYLRELRDKRWLKFDARENLGVSEKKFVWDARVSWKSHLHIHVNDRLTAAGGEGRVSCFGLPIARSRPGTKMNSSSVCRYLAEGVWAPGILSSPDVEWSAIDDHTARAKLNDPYQLELVFHFRDNGEVDTIFAPARWGKFEHGLEEKPWEVRLGEYFDQDGFHLPRTAIVGWYIDDVWVPVWKGFVEKIMFVEGNNGIQE